jgi:hypothetical protein
VASENPIGMRLTSGPHGWTGKVQLIATATIYGKQYAYMEPVADAYDEDTIRAFLQEAQRVFLNLSARRHERASAGGRGSLD